jgi:hypothetical protein
MNRVVRVQMGVLLGVLAALGCAHGGIGSAGGWSVVQSKHFSLYTLYPRDTQLLLRELELAYTSLGATFFKAAQLPRIDALVFTEETFGEVMGFHRNAVALARAPGGGDIGKDGLLITKDDKAPAALAEALAHLFIAKTFTGAPLWFHEGFAGYVRTVQYRYGGGGQMACFGLPPNEKEPLVPLRKLIAMSWDDYDSDEGRNWYRFTSRLVIDYILHGADGKNAPRLRLLIEAVSAGKPGAEALEAAFPNVALEVLDRKLSEHAADLAYKMSGAVPPRGLCPLPAAIASGRGVDETPPQISPAPAEPLAALFQAVLRLPRRQGYPPWYPADVIGRAK